jgi:hypothetical protein
VSEKHPDPTWNQVVAWVNARRIELIDDLDSMNSDEVARRDAAVRRDELLTLLGIPSVLAAAEKVEAPVKPRAQY